MKSKKIVAMIVAFAAFMAVATSGLAAVTTTTEYYIIKRISTTLGVNGTQSITAMKYYPAYPF